MMSTEYAHHQWPQTMLTHCTFTVMTELMVTYWACSACMRMYCACAYAPQAKWQALGASQFCLQLVLEGV
jgi:ribosomal protein L37AE/L43A